MRFTDNILDFIKHVASLAVQFVKYLPALASKIAAYILYLEICFVYYSTKGVGFVIYMLIFSFGFFNQGTDPIRTFCLLYVAYLFGLIMVLQVVLRFKKVRDWLCREVGEERVLKKIYNSPLLSKTTKFFLGAGTLIVADQGVTGVVNKYAYDETNHRLAAAQARADQGKAGVREDIENQLAEARTYMGKRAYTNFTKNRLAYQDKKLSEFDTFLRTEVTTINAQAKRHNSILTDYNTTLQHQMFYKTATTAVEETAGVLKSWKLPWPFGGH